MLELIIEYFRNYNLPLNELTIFWFCALTGTGIFIIQLLFNLFGFTDHEDLDGDGASDHRKVKWLSMQTIGGFLMMFGWTAITCKKELSFQITNTIILSLIAGFFTVFITRTIFKLANKLHSSGNVHSIDEAIGKEAYVYQRIPKDGVGKISISLQQFTCEIDAVTNDGEELDSFTRVHIIKKQDHATVVVIPIQNR